MKRGEWLWDQIESARPGKARDYLLSEFGHALWGVDHYLPDNPDVVDRLVDWNLHGYTPDTYTLFESQDFQLAWDDTMQKVDELDTWYDPELKDLQRIVRSWWQRFCMKHGWVEEVDPNRLVFVSRGRTYDFKTKGIQYDFRIPNLDEEMEDEGGN